MVTSILRKGEQENTEDDYTKGLIVSFTAKKVGGSDEPKKAPEPAETKAEEAAEATTEAADTKTEKATEGGDEDDKLTREDIKGGLAKFGIIRVSLHQHFYYTAECIPCT